MSTVQENYLLNQFQRYRFFKNINNLLNGDRNKFVTKVNFKILFINGIGEN
jgi:hypothetical protein